VIRRLIRAVRERRHLRAYEALVGPLLARRMPDERW